MSKSSPPRGPNRARRKGIWKILPEVIGLALIAGVVMNGASQPANVSVADGGHDTHTAQVETALKQKQKPGLDPNADDGSHPELTDPHNHVGEQLAPGTGANVKGLSQDAINRAFGDALSVKKGGKWTYGKSLGSGFYGVHAVVMPGKILVIAGSGNSLTNFKAGSFRSMICSSRLDGCKAVKTPKDMFCSGHVLLPDGRVLVGGGTEAYGAWKGAKYLWVFNPRTNTYQQLKPMEVGRWYPTLITVSGGQTLITGGINQDGAFTSSSEMFDYRNNTHRLIAQYSFGATDSRAPYYLHLHLTDNPNVVYYSGAALGGYTGRVSPQFWNFRTKQVRKVPGLRAPTKRSSAASCFLGDSNDGVLAIMGGNGGNRYVDWVDLDSKSPRYRPGPNLRAAKEYLSCTQAPNGYFYEANGGSSNFIQNASYEVSVFKKYRGAPTALNPMPPGNHRLYHSNLLFLDDGRIVSFGSNPKNQARSMSVLYFSPPEIQGKRPTLTKIPSTVKRGSTIKIKAGSGATKLVFRAPDMSTHGMNAGGYIQTFDIKKGGKVTVNLSAATMPPGYYQVTTVDTKGSDKGQYSKARWVKVIG